MLPLAAGHLALGPARKTKQRSKRSRPKQQNQGQAESLMDGTAKL